MTNQAPQQVFELSTEEPVRSFFVVDGEKYDLQTPDDLSIVDLRFVFRLWKHLIDADAKDSLSEKEGKIYEENLAKILRLIAPSLPEEIVTKPNWRSSKIGICVAFFTNAPKSNPLLNRMNLDWLMSSLNSNDSTEETSNAG